MCGIFGSIHLTNRSSSDRDIVAHGVQSLAHRGPDDFGVETNGQCCFGHSRLSIIDLDSGHQPMYSSDRRGLICYNGEVYNFRELRVELEALGFVFITHSDTEVILNAYLAWGSDCLKRFRGMYAFAALDSRTMKVLIARDRLGKKPLFYAVRNKRLFFSSELEPLYTALGDCTIDLHALDEYLHWQYIHAPRTIYEEVFSLEPAHYLEIDLASGAREKLRYWKLSFREDRSKSLDDWVRILDEAIRESVRLRLVSDVPFGSFLSGGVDSSLITGYMAEILDQPVKTFSIGFKEADFSELSFARRASEINHTEHHEEVVEADSLGLLPLLVKHYGQPFADSSAIPTYYVSRMARKYVKMVLSGDGGDENFAGYHSYEYVMRGLRGDARGQHLKKVAYLYYSFLKRLCAGAGETGQAYDLHCHTSKHFDTFQRRALLRKEFRGIVAEDLPQRKALMDIGNEPTISRLQNLDLMAYLPYDILTKVDIASMANSLEVRCPLVDHVLVELAATIPAELKLKEESREGKTSYQKKFILRQLALRRYPVDFVDRKKMGFGVPLGIWFAGRLKAQVTQRLMTSEYLPSFFEMKEIRDLAERHTVGDDRSARIWNILFFDEWLRTHADALPQ